MGTLFLQAIASGLAIGAIYALVAVSFSITFMTTRTLNFAQGNFVAIGSFVSASTLLMLTGAPEIHSLNPATSGGLNYVLSVIAAGVILAAIGVVLFLVAVRPFAGKPGLSWVISTLGFGVIIQSLGLMVWGAAPVFIPPPFGEDVIRIASAGVRSQEILVFVVAITIMFVLDFLMRRSRAGKAMRAVAYNPQAASLMGINVTGVMIAAFALSSGMAGVSGALIAPITSASLFVGLSLALKGFAASILGGLDNPRGCIIGGFLIGISESLVAMWQAQWREVVVFLVIILVLSVRPYGLFGAGLKERA
jgi:branched-chain amino acid transport system permease protein